MTKFIGDRVYEGVQTFEKELRLAHLSYEPTNEPGFGKVYVSESDGYLYFLNEDGIKVNLVGQNETTEDLVFYINPDTGIDPAPNTPLRITTQEQSNAYGRFASVAGACRVCPKLIRHGIEFIIDDGNYIISPNFFDGLVGLTVTSNTYGYVLSSTAGINPKIKSSSKLKKVDSTITSTVQSHINKYTITLTEDPGYSDDAYQAKWLKIVDGAGKGEYKAIRYHSGTVFEVAGRFGSIDATSKVEIYEESVTLTYNNNYPEIILPTKFDDRFGDEYIVGLLFSGIKFDFWPDVAHDFIAFSGNCALMFDAVSIIGTPYFRGVIDVELNNLIVRDAVLGYGVIGSNTNIRGGTGDSSWLVRNTIYGVYGFGTGHVGVSFYLYKGAVDDCNYGIYLENSFLDMYGSSTRSSGNTVGISLQNGSHMNIDISNAMVHGGISGEIEVEIEGISKSYEEINNARSCRSQPKNDLSGHIEVLNVESETTTGDGYLAYTSSDTSIRYQAPGDSVGSLVNVGNGGRFIIKSDNNKWIEVFVNPTLPITDQNDTFTITGAQITEVGSTLKTY